MVECEGECGESVETDGCVATCEHRIASSASIQHPGERSIKLRGGKIYLVLISVCRENRYLLASRPL